MMRHCLMAGVCLLLLGSVLLARQGTVRTYDGQVIEGQVEERRDSLIVTVRGIETIIPRENVQSVEYADSDEARYRQRYEQLPPEDAQARVELARWAFDRRMYGHARDVLEEAIQIEPRNQEAWTLLETVRSQIRLERTRQRQEVERQRPQVAQIRLERPVVNADQINIIRQREVRRPADLNIRLRFERDVRRRFVNAYPITMAQFNSLRPFDQADLILREGDPRMAEDVRVLQDPVALLEYRRGIQPMILAGCAASGCHGGGTTDFFLHNPANSEALAYTNFLTLQQYTRMVEQRATIFGPGEAERRLIDRSHPERSLLLEYALPPSIATTPHPEVQGYRGVFARRDDRGYQRILGWIRNYLSPVEPNYGFTLDRPADRERPTEADEPVEPEPEPLAEPQEAMPEAEAEPVEENS